MQDLTAYGVALLLEVQQYTGPREADVAAVIERVQAERSHQLAVNAHAIAQATVRLRRAEQELASLEAPTAEDTALAEARVVVAEEDLDRVEAKADLDLVLMDTRLVQKLDEVKRSLE